jgi:hypothetical protein
LKDLPESAFARTGNHTERGPINLLQMVAGGADHLESHARQAQAIRDAYKETKGKR